jgi:hypothetical protein
MSRQLIAIFLVLLFTSCGNTERAKQADPIEAKVDTTVKKDTIVKIEPVPKSVSNTGFSDHLDLDNIQKATVSKSDSLIWLTANMKFDHRMIGYDQPDTNSKKMILFSIFTRDVKDNPFNCPLGSYYSTSDMENTKLKFIGNAGSFIKASIIKDNNVAAIIYIEKIWVAFDDQ